MIAIGALHTEPWPANPWPRWRVLSFSASLSDLANLIGNPYLRLLVAAIETGRVEGAGGEA